jgi:ATP-binding cassette subfamily B protein
MWSRQNEIRQAEETLRRAAMEEGGEPGFDVEARSPDGEPDRRPGRDDPDEAREDVAGVADI